MILAKQQDFLSLSYYIKIECSYKYVNTRMEKVGQQEMCSSVVPKTVEITNFRNNFTKKLYLAYIVV